MKTLASTLFTGLLFVSLAAPVFGQPPGSKDEPPIVGARYGNGADAPTRVLRLEYQLRILANYNPGRMTVHTVFAGGPATKLVTADEDRAPGTLEPGDVITHVDGRRIVSMDDYYRAMYVAGAHNGKVKLRVIDVNTGDRVDFETVAERVGGGRAQPKPRADAKRATKVKALLIGATRDEKIGEGVSKNLQAMEQYVRGLPNFKAETDLARVTGDDVTAQGIMRAVAGLHVEATETLFCYVACHGAHDENLGQGDPSGGHFFQLPGGDLMRRSLLGGLVDCGGQLTVLISDTCNAPALYIPPRVEGMPPEAVKSPALTELLYGFTGLVDVSGSCAASTAGTAIRAAGLR